MKHPSHVIREGLPTLSLCALISIFSGFFLNQNEGMLRMLPGILIIIPSFISVNGNISSVLSSRLSSALHTGLVKPDFKSSKVLNMNLHSVVIISLVSFPTLGFFGALINSVISVRYSDFLFFPLVTLLAGMVTTSILVFISIMSSYLTYRHGLDPDNIVVPILTTIGDFVGIAVLMTMTGLLL